MVFVKNFLEISKIPIFLFSQWHTGQYVRKGQTLGYYADNKADALCTGGSSTGAHLHFSLHYQSGKQWSLSLKYLGTYRVVNKRKRSYDTNCTYSYLRRTSKTPKYDEKKYCPGKQSIRNFGSYW